VKRPRLTLGKIPLVHKVAIGGVGIVAIGALARYWFGWEVAIVLLIGALVIVGLWFGLNLIVKRRNKKKGDAFSKELSVSEKESKVSKAEVRRALEELGRRWVAAVDELRRSGLNLYSMPWYLLFGEPQSGKSTTLKNSSLEFPVGIEALSGAGGTRNCDWWFTNEAVILDTAGRFSFQEQNAPDQQEWQTFLALLRKHRGYCPINGVIVAVPCTSLLGDTSEQIEEKAQNIRDKLREIQRTLEIRFPVFLLVTKCDTILGFTEFFTKLDAAERRQLLGWSNPRPFDQQFDPNEFPRIFDGLCAKAHQLRMRFLCDEISTREVDKQFVFPEEFRSIRKPLQQYADTIFAQSRYVQPPFFRGVYFTSGLQQGRPIARACAELLRDRGDAASDVVENLEEMFQKSRAFFIRDFYREKVFKEQGLVVRSEGAMKRDKLTRRLVWTCGSVIAVASIAFVVFRLFNVQAKVADVDANVRMAAVTVEPGLRLEGIDLSKVNPSEEPLALASELNPENVRMRAPWWTIADPQADLEDIHRVLFRETCLEPFIRDCEDMLVNEAALRRPDEFTNAFEEYLKWWAERQRQSEGPDVSHLEVRPFVELAWKGTDEDKEIFASEFIVFRDQDKGNPTKTLELDSEAWDKVLTPALDNYKRQWDVEEAMGWWRQLWGHVKDADGAYRNILALADDPEVRRSGDLTGQFRNYAGTFQEKIEEISKHLQLLKDNPDRYKRAQLTREKYTNEAGEAYNNLKELLGESPEVGKLVRKIDAQYEVVKKDIEDKYEDVVGGERNKRYAHIVDISGQSPEAPPAEGAKGAEKKLSVRLTVHAVSDEGKSDAVSVADYLAAADDFIGYTETPGADFREWERGLAREMRENLGFAHFGKWHDGQVEKRQSLVEKLNKYDLHDNWNTDALQNVTESVGDMAVVKWDIAAVGVYDNKLVSHYEELDEQLRSAPADMKEGYVPPIFKLAACRQAVDDSGVVRQDIEKTAQSDAQNRLLEGIDNILIKYLRRYTAFWQGIYEGFDPRQKGNLRQAKTWQEFKGNEVFQWGAGSDLFDPGQWPVKDLFEQAAPQELHAIIGRVNGAESDRELQRRFQRISRTLTFYNRSEMTRLQDVCDDFVQCISKLDDNAADAWRELGGGEDEDPVSWSKIQALSKFQARTRRVQDEVFAKELAAVQDMGLDLLFKDTKSVFNTKWKALVAEYEVKLKDEFPFMRPTLSGEPLQKDAHVPCADLSTIKDFFGQNGLGGLVEEFQLDQFLVGDSEQTDFPKRYDLLADKREFVSRCRKLEEFLFRQREHDVKIEYSDEQEDRPFGSEYTTLSLRIPQQEIKTFIASSDDPANRSQSLKWNPGSAVGPLIIEAEIQGSEYKDSRTFDGGSVSLLAFVVAFGSPEDDADRTRWVVRVELPAAGLGSSVAARLTFEFDQAVPEFPIWTMAQG